MRKNAKGMTLVEIVLVTGILGILVMTISSILLYSQNRLRRNQELTEARTDVSLATRILWTELRSAGPSFNVLNVPDDSGLNFFDWLPDFPDRMLTPAQRERTLTLSAAGTNSVVMVLIDEKALPQIQYDPAQAYDHTTNPDPLADGALSFISVDRANIVSAKHGRLWHNGSILMLYSPIGLRPSGAAMTVPPRYLTFFGRVNGASLDQETAGGLLAMTHPLDATAVTTADEFFRKVPTAGGGSSAVLLQKVQIARFSLVGDPATGRNALMRHYWTTSGWAGAFKMGANVDEVVFRRDTITVPMISINVKTGTN